MCARWRPAHWGCWVVLSRFRSSGNLGCLVRTCAAVNGAGFILLGGSIDPFDPNVIRATMGAVFRQRFVRTTCHELRRWVERHKLQVVGASPDGSVPYDKLQYRSPPLLVLGEERHGLDPQQRSICEILVRIPVARGMDSLNLSVAGGILMYEALRSSQ